MDNKVLSEKTLLAATLKNEIDEAELALSQKSAKYKTLCNEIINMLEAMDISSVKMHGFNFYTQEKSSVKIPKTLEEKQMLFNYLKEINLFDEIITVHSATLNSLYKSLSEQEEEKGNFDFQLPGVEPATSYKSLVLKRI